MLRPYRSGEQVPGGTYWNPYTGQFLDLETQSTLPETRGAFFRVSVPVLILLGPFLGLFFLVFVPLAVPLVVGHWLFQKVRSAFSGRGAAPTVSPPRPARAH